MNFFNNAQVVLGVIVSFITILGALAHMVRRKKQKAAGKLRKVAETNTIPPMNITNSSHISNSGGNMIGNQGSVINVQSKGIVFGGIGNVTSTNNTASNIADVPHGEHR